MSTIQDQLVAAGEVTFDLSTLTLGEAGEAERQSGLAISAILRSPATLRQLAIFVHLSRNSAKPPLWSDLSSLRLLDALPSPSPARSSNRSAT